MPSYYRGGTGPGADSRRLRRRRDRLRAGARPAAEPVLAPHPDDEVLATGGVIQQALARGIPVRVVFLTNGDSNEFSFLFFRKAITLNPRAAVEAGTTRAFEAMRAGRELGLRAGDEFFLGYPDFGTLEIWLSRWGEREAFRSLFTERNAIPYWFAVQPDSPYKGESILADLQGEIAEFRPTKIFVSHPADTNPDHEALYLFLRVALWNLDKQPEVYAYLTHFGRWPQPEGLYVEAPQEPPARLDEEGRWVALPLTAEQVTVKKVALTRHRTQFEASTRFLESYLRRNESFDTPGDIALPENDMPIVLLPSGSSAAGESPPPQAWSDGETRTIRRADGELILTFTRRHADQRFRLQAFLIGYRKDRLFGEMPKIEIDLSGDRVKVTDRRQRISESAVTVTTNGPETELRVPLALLGQPDYLFLAAHSRPDLIRFDSMPWVVLRLGAE